MNLQLVFGNPRKQKSGGKMAIKRKNPVKKSVKDARRKAIKAEAKKRGQTTDKKGRTTSAKKETASEKRAKLVRSLAEKNKALKKKLAKKKVAKKKVTKKKVAKKATPKKKVAKKVTAKKKVAKKVTAKKKVAKKATSKKRVASKKRATSKKKVARKATPKKRVAKKVTSKKKVAKKATSKKRVARKATSKKKTTRKSFTAKNRKAYYNKKKTLKKGQAVVWKHKAGKKTFINRTLRSNPMKGVSMKLQKYLKHDLSEAGGLFIGSVANQAINEGLGKLAPQLALGVGKVFGKFSGSVISLAVGVGSAMGADKMKNKQAQNVAKGMIGSAVVALGATAYEAIRQMTGGSTMSGFTVGQERMSNWEQQGTDFGGFIVDNGMDGFVQGDANLNGYGQFEDYSLAGDNADFGYEENADFGYDESY